MRYALRVAVAREHRFARMTNSVWSVRRLWVVPPSYILQIDLGSPSVSADEKK